MIRHHCIPSFVRKKSTASSIIGFSRAAAGLQSSETTHNNSAENFALLPWLYHFVGCCWNLCTHTYTVGQILFINKIYGKISLEMCCFLRSTWPCGHTFRPKVWPSKSFSTKAQRSTFWNTIMPIVEVQPQDSDSCVPRHVSYLLNIIVPIRGILSWSASILWGFFRKKESFDVLPSIAAVPIAVGIMSPEARMASNLDINTDNLKTTKNLNCYTLWQIKGWLIYAK